ncbi:hypothetical protein SAMN05216283_102647 [Sunxiuqinia elliptica]|uniref:Uncharacterized protein n=1 Tax=Sunxiuqinia elliptica TaxID=655355 RepID=A0A1I2FYJ6_9BACT|nr:hypothetical protein SAMN05216283_102647 [Sunxiuqinia elliptica]
MILIGLLVVLLFFPSNLSAKRINFNFSTIVPTVTGYVEVKGGSNRNHYIKIKISNLDRIEKMECSELTYVLWMETDQDETENLGQLVSTPVLFSSKLQVTVETVSSYQPVKVFITTESEVNVQYPGQQVVLTTDRF